jgi:NTP pyrophosphatase (non-canonical NTP hydrolase)
MTIREFQKQIEALYLERDRARGVDGTFTWFVEEIGELATALRTRDRANLEEEFADVAAWLVTLASLLEVDLDTAVGKYGDGCPRCAATPCACPEKP